MAASQEFKNKLEKERIKQEARDERMAECDAKDRAEFLERRIDNERHAFVNFVVSGRKKHSFTMRKFYDPWYFWMRGWETVEDDWVRMNEMFTELGANGACFTVKRSKTIFGNNRLTLEFVEEDESACPKFHSMLQNRRQNLQQHAADQKIAKDKNTDTISNALLQRATIRAARLKKDDTIEMVVKDELHGYIDIVNRLDSTCYQRVVDSLRDQSDGVFDCQFIDGWFTGPTIRCRITD
jgi:hypothetical protein